jgi:uncharacterized protein
VMASLPPPPIIVGPQKPGHAVEQPLRACTPRLGVYDALPHSHRHRGWPKRRAHSPPMGAIRVDAIGRVAPSPTMDREDLPNGRWPIRLPHASQGGHRIIVACQDGRMSRILAENVFTDPIEHSQMGRDEVLEGAPTVGLNPLDQLGDAELGLWEVDEVFIVLSGAGWVRFASGENIALTPGLAVRLNAGEQTTWTITKPLRKIYLA